MGGCGVADNYNVPLDLRNWREVPAPKFKKEYPGKRVRVNKDPYRFNYIGPHGLVVPPEAVYYVESRQLYAGTAHLRCLWRCPCCNSAHYRDIDEEGITKGEVVFVEDTLEPSPEAEGLIYLGSPYSHPDFNTRQFRFLAVAQAAAVLMASMPKMRVFAPICLGHPVTVCGQQAGIRGDFAQWQDFDLFMLEQSTHFVALLLEGWSESEGLKAEWEHARRRGLAIYSMSQDRRLTKDPHLNFREDR